jgi:diaminohydroxyphosphoribosylaminopyrimidine deaminase/5-amino-6-(5-phosphoribosylamino)uracil reductase
MVEGGGRLLAAFVRASAWQQLWVYRAPILLGGEARPAFAALGLTRVADAPRVRLLRRRTLGDDELCVYANA